MTLTSLPSFRAAFALVFALSLTGCSTHPCNDIDEHTLADGHLDYAFEDGTQTSADFAPADSTTTARAEGGALDVTWFAPLSAAAHDEANFLLTMKLPHADGSFDVGALSGEVCACRNSQVTRGGGESSCLTGTTMTPPPVECQPVTGHLEVHHTKLGVCDSKDGCPDVIVELVLTSPAEKGLSGNFTFLNTETVTRGSCVDSPFDFR